jgi:hypothetical protein
MSRIEAVRWLAQHTGSAPSPPRGNNVTATDINCLSYWFPKLEAAGIPVPKTIILYMDKALQADLYSLICDGTKPTLDPRPFLQQIRIAGDSVGWPCFLRTGHTSGKHNWDQTCFLKSPDAVGAHVSRLVEDSEMAGLMGLPWNVWAIRRLLPTKHLTICPLYGNMPVTREFRYFFKKDRIVCFHPYWPMQAIEEGGGSLTPAEWKELYSPPPPEADALAQKVGATINGEWSIDILSTDLGWFVIDMAEASKSFHRDSCPRKRMFQ